MSWFLRSTVGRAAVFYVDILCAFASKALCYDFGDDDE